MRTPVHSLSWMKVDAGACAPTKLKACLNAMRPIPRLSRTVSVHVFGTIVFDRKNDEERESFRQRYHAMKKFKISIVKIFDRRIYGSNFGATASHPAIEMVKRPFYWPFVCIAIDFCLRKTDSKSELDKNNPFHFIDSFCRSINVARLQVLSNWPSAGFLLFMFASVRLESTQVPA